MGNGAFWRGDQQGLFSAGYRVHVPEIPAHVTVEVPVNIPITASFTNTVYSGITLEQINFGFTIDIAGIPLLAGAISKAVLPPITGTGPAITVNIGDPGGSTAIRIPATASVGPFDVTFVNIAATTGFFNATTDPSSGFFNGGPGTVSGIANIGATFPASRTSRTPRPRASTTTARCNRDWRTWAIPSRAYSTPASGHRPTSRACSTSAATSRGSSTTRRPGCRCSTSAWETSANSTSASPT